MPSGFYMTNIYLIPHYDDEVFIGPQIRLDVERGYPLVLIFLTQSSDSELTARRQFESRKYLSYLGVSADQLIFLGESLDVLDGSLVNRIRDVVSAIEKRNIQKSVIYAPMWEGGHPDHDAACVIGHLLSGSEVRCYSTYTGSATRWKFFSVIKVCSELKKGVIEIYDGDRLAINRWRLYDICVAVITFKSQILSWIFLAPPMIVRIIFDSQFYLYRRREKKFDMRPHEGKLLYERHNRMKFLDFQNSMKEFKNE